MLQSKLSLHSSYVNDLAYLCILQVMVSLAGHLQSIESEKQKLRSQVPQISVKYSTYFACQSDDSSMVTNFPTLNP